MFGYPRARSRNIALESHLRQSNSCKLPGKHSEFGLLKRLGAEMALARRPGNAPSTTQPVVVEAGRLESRGAGDDLADDVQRPGPARGLPLAAGVVAVPGGGEIAGGPELIDDVAFDSRPRSVRFLERRDRPVAPDRVAAHDQP